MFYRYSICVDACTSGYTEKIGDIPGWGTSLGSALDANRDECAQKCSELPLCLSFEHSNTELKCNLNTEAEPASNGAYKDYAFCSKIGKIQLIKFLI